VTARTATGRPPGGPDLLTPAQAASLLGVSTASVRLWAAEGRLAFTTTPGGHRRFQRGDVLELALGSGGRVEVAPTAVVDAPSDLGTRERVWVRAICSAMRAASADLGARSQVGARLALEAERWELTLDGRGRTR
jgi:excisionase family DNA binding protein